ncbi:MAG: TolC family protein, partial [Bryocella sp.]
LKQTQQREAAREVAHFDALKADLTVQQRKRDLADAQQVEQRARLDLGVLLFPDPRTWYTVALPTPSPLPDRGAVEAAIGKANPEVASALASVRAASIGVTAAKATFLPSLVLNYSYGIDAPTFAINAPDQHRQLGYSASATLDIPIFDWFATDHRVKQAQILRDVAKVKLSATQRMLIANTESFFSEAHLAQGQLTSLQETVKTAGDALRLARLRYGSGEGSVLEVVDAQTTLTTSELALEDGRVRFQLALANLQTLTGNY